jgi:hypothetical protein
VLFAINYRLVQGTKHRYPVAVHDTRAAVQLLRSHAAGAPPPLSRRCAPRRNAQGWPQGPYECRDYRGVSWELLLLRHGPVWLAGLDPFAAARIR